MVQIQTYKGWFFVFVTSILFYLLIKKSNSRLKKSKKKTEQALKEKQVLLSELHHRVKNNLAIIYGLIELQLNELDEKASVPLQEAQYRIYTLADIEELMYQNEDMSNIPFHIFLQNLTSTVENINNYKLSVDTYYEEVFLNVNQAVPLGLLLNELFSQLRINRNLIEDDSINLRLTTDEPGQVNVKLAFRSRPSKKQLELDRKDLVEGMLIDLFSEQLESSSYWKKEDDTFTFELSFKKSVKKGVVSTLRPTIDKMA